MPFKRTKNAGTRQKREKNFSVVVNSPPFFNVFSTAEPPTLQAWSDRLMLVSDAVGEREREKISHADCGRSKKGRKNLQTSGMRGGENTEQLSSFFQKHFLRKSRVVLFVCTVYVYAYFQAHASALGPRPLECRREEVVCPWGRISWGELSSRRGRPIA